MNVISINAKLADRYRERVQHLIMLSEQILDSAREGDWAGALQTQRLRSEQLSQFFSDTDLNQECAELVAAGIRKMLDIDAEVTDIVYQGRNNLATEAINAQKQGRAAKAYLTNLN